MVEIAKLFEAAQKIRARAYAPYSLYAVGAALIDENGEIHAGCNVEAANLKGGTCAEGTAIAKMISEGGRKIRDIALVGSDDGICTPCGHCRQLIREFSDANTKIHAGNKDATQIKTYTMEELLPDSFGPQNLAR